MKKWLVLGIIALSIALLASVKQIHYVENKYETAVANMKAYDVELSNAKTKNTAYQLTVSQLEYFQDSILQELNSTREKLRIKDKNLKALQAVSSTFTKKDTVVFHDTLFSDPSLAMDTVIQDEWYSVRLGLQYPSTIAVSPCFQSRKHIIVSMKRETVNPPKKFFLLRWFQKRHTVLHVDVVEKNPYVDNQNSKYIEIIK